MVSESCEWPSERVVRVSLDVVERLCLDICFSAACRAMPAVGGSVFSGVERWRHPRPSLSFLLPCPRSAHMPVERGNVCPRTEAIFQQNRRSVLLGTHARERQMVNAQRFSPKEYKGMPRYRGV